jgi:hypothetical protein
MINKGFTSVRSKYSVEYMKSITYGDEVLVTSNSIAEQLVEYAVRVSQLGTSSAVTIPVLGSNGLIVDHTLVINVASQLNVVDVDGFIDGRETDRFGAPDFPAIGSRAAVQPDGGGATTTFDDFGDVL